MRADAVLAARAQQETAAASALPEARAAASRAAELIKQDDDAAMEAGSTSDESSGDEIDVDGRIPSSAPEAAVKQEEGGFASSVMQGKQGNTSAGAAQHLQPGGVGGINAGQGPHDRGGQAGAGTAVQVKQEISDPEEQATHHGEPQISCSLQDSSTPSSLPCSSLSHWLLPSKMWMSLPGSRAVETNFAASSCMADADPAPVLPLMRACQYLNHCPKSPCAWCSIIAV